jgi:hypothetical protein
MSEETTPEQLDRVQRLAEAINEKKRMEADESHSVEDRMRADIKMNHALDEVRAHKAEEKSETPGSAPTN